MDSKKCPWCKRTTYSANKEAIDRCESCGQDISIIPLHNGIQTQNENYFNEFWDKIKIITIAINYGLMPEKRERVR